MNLLIKIHVENTKNQSVSNLICKHISKSKTAYKLIKQWIEQYHSTPKLPWESDHERNRSFGRTSETIYLTITHIHFARSNSHTGCWIMLNQFTTVNNIFEIISRFSKKRETNWCMLVSPSLIYIRVKLCHWDKYTIYLI